MEITYQEDNGDVQHEGDHGVGQESPDADVVDVVHSQGGNLKEQSSDTVHDSADRSEVVKRDKRVHLVLRGAEQALHHDQSGSLKDDTGNLEEETDEDKLDLTERGDDDTDDNDADVCENLEVDGCHAHTPSGKQNSNRSGGLK